jgi:hypothetical protein
MIIYRAWHKDHYYYGLGKYDDQYEDNSKKGKD